MTTSIRAKYTNGTLVPLEPLDLEEGQEVTVRVEGAVTVGDDQDPNAPMRAVGNRKAKAESVSKPAGAEPQKEKEPFKVVPLASGFAPGVNPENLKDVILDLEDEEFLEKLGE